MPGFKMYWRILVEKNLLIAIEITLYLAVLLGDNLKYKQPYNEN